MQLLIRLSITKGSKCIQVFLSEEQNMKSLCVLLLSTGSEHGPYWQQGYFSGDLMWLCGGPVLVQWVRTKTSEWLQDRLWWNLRPFVFHSGNLQWLRHHTNATTLINFNYAEVTFWLFQLFVRYDGAWRHEGLCKREGFWILILFWHAARAKIPMWDKSDPLYLF